MNLKNKTIVITGAARGLGASMAKRLAQKKCKLALVDLNTESIANTAADCKEALEIKTYAANVSNEEQVISLFNQIDDDMGTIDGLINNAGITRDALLIKFKDGKVISKMSLDDWQAVIDINLTGVFLCGREAAQHMIQKENGGVIINISSVSHSGNMGQTNYSAAKSGVASMTVTWAKELARYGIRTGSIAPGFINTEMVAGMKSEAREKLTSGIPLKRMGEPDEIANAVEFIFENDYFSGRMIEVDGALRL